MELIPHTGAGALRFGMDEAAVRAVLGAPPQRTAYDEARTALAFGDVDLLMHAEHGLVSITLDAGPAELHGADLFTLDREGIETLLAPRASSVWEPVDRLTATLSAPSLGLIVYFDLDEPAPRAVELVSGTWRGGARVG